MDNFLQNLKKVVPIMLLANQIAGKPVRISCHIIISDTNAITCHQNKEECY